VSVVSRAVRGPAAEESLTCDVVVVGSGSGGGAAAARLAEQGLDVVVLEEGPHVTNADFSLSVAETMPRLYRDAGLTVIYGRPNILFQEGRCVGGSTVVNGGMAWRPSDPVLRAWRTGHGLDFATPTGLEPYLAAAEDAIGVGWQSPESLSEADIAFRRSAQALGIPVRLNRRAQRHCMGSNVCVLGCPDNRKQAAHLTYIPRAVRAGARLLPDCRVVRVLAPSGPAEGVLAHRVGGSSGWPASGRPALRVRSRAVVLACGALQTPALLSRSRLGNRWVGRNFLCHPNVKVVGLFDRDIRQWAGVHQGHQIHHFIDDGFLLATGGLPPGIIAAGLPQVAEANLQVMEQYNRMLVTAAMVEDTTSGSVLGPRGLWPPGLLWPRYQLDQRQVSRIRRAVAVLARIQLHAGATRVLLPLHAVPEVSTMDDVVRLEQTTIDPAGIEAFTVHAMGTCAMGADPRRHATGPDGQLWGVRNLFVADASVLPTSPGVNPQLTIQAMALRIADQVADRLR
jgi:choline dehydrogenase-like flavoprotein